MIKNIILFKGGFCKIFPSELVSILFESDGKIGETGHLDLNEVER